MMQVLVIIGVVAALFFYLISRMLEARTGLFKAKNALLDNHKQREELVQAFNQKYSDLKEEIYRDIEKMSSEMTSGFPWFAEALSEYHHSLDKVYASHLMYKKHPAVAQALKIKEIAQEKKLFKKEFTTSKYILRYYESIFPWLSEYLGMDSADVIKGIYENVNENISDDDPVKFYVAAAEYDRLTPAERNQRALDRYWSGREKKPWQIGRDYERYVGYLYESKGYKVTYFGVENGLEDLGRDLICENAAGTEIVQCKNWSTVKNIPIRENHINQLFGTTVQYYLALSGDERKYQLDIYQTILRKKQITPTIFTSTYLSPTAKTFAQLLGIKIIENHSLDYSYPSIKCNIGASGEKIYHLPFDQQYDKIDMQKGKGEKYLRTVAEAELQGFRRAWKWRG